MLSPLAEYYQRLAADDRMMLQLANHPESKKYWAKRLAKSEELMHEAQARTRTSLKEAA